MCWVGICVLCVCGDMGDVVRCNACVEITSIDRRWAGAQALEATTYDKSQSRASYVREGATRRGSNTPNSCDVV
jgi:hypothetical protein